MNQAKKLNKESVTGKILLAGLLFFTLLAPSSQSNASIISSNDGPQLIPDNNASGITSTLEVESNFVISDVNLIIDELMHVFVSDLHIELTSPTGTTSTIIKASSEGGIFFNQGMKTNLIGTVLDDDAATNLVNGNPPFTGAFNVEHASVIANPLSVFDGEDSLGTWTLFISDLEQLDIGSLNAWSIELTSAAPVPIPAAFWLFGAGLIGLSRLTTGKSKNCSGSNL